MPAKSEVSKDLSVVEAKALVIESLEQYPTWPEVASVRNLAIAYLGFEPTKTIRKEVDRKFIVGYGPTSKFLRKIVMEKVTIGTEQGPATIGFETITHHDKRFGMPGIVALGSLAFRGEPDHRPLERLYLVDATHDPIRVEVSEGSEMQTAAAAEFLLQLPDEPTRLLA